MSALIHIVDGDAIVSGGSVYARCGARVDRHHGLWQTPTCAECVRLDKQDAADLVELDLAAPSVDTMNGPTAERRAR